MTNSGLDLLLQVELCPLAYTDALFVDCAVWYHLVLSVDTTQSTAADRLKMYVNGVSQSFVTLHCP